MSICENVSELLHELRCAAGTVLTILGSRLEAQERARVDEVGPQWLTEFEEQRDVWEPHEQFEGCCTFHAPANFDIEPEDSAAVSAAADPSPTVPNAHSVVGDCPGSDSVILPTVEPGPQTAVETGHDMGLNWACEMFPQHQKHAPSRADASAPPAVSAQTCSSDGRADAVAIAESVTHEDLYMHLVRAAHRANTGHVDVLIEEFTNSLLADFREPICDNLADLLHRAADVLFASDAHCPALIAELRTRADRFAAVESVIGYGRGTAGE